jgi:hypothetical protein
MSLLRANDPLIHLIISRSFSLSPRQLCFLVYRTASSKHHGQILISIQDYRIALVLLLYLMEV